MNFITHSLLMAERLLRREGREDLRQTMLDPAFQLK